MGVLEDINSLLDNKNINSVLSLVIALYAALAAPALPNSVVLFFDTVLGKLLLIFLIGYVSSRNIQVALMIAVAFVVTLHVGNQRSIEEYINYRNREFFEGSTKLTCDCTQSDENANSDSDSPPEDDETDEKPGDTGGENTGSGSNEATGGGNAGGPGEDFEDDALTEQFISGNELTEDNADYDIEEYKQGPQYMNGNTIAGTEFFKNNGVQPAYNLSGNTRKMYAPL